MSDIRSFFAPKGEKSKANGKEKSKEIKSTVMKEENNNNSKLEKKKNKRRIIDSESDSEEPLPTKLRKDKPEKTKNKTSSSNLKTDDTVKEKTKVKKDRITQKNAAKDVLKPTTAADFFGSGTSKTSSTSGKRKQTEASLDKGKDKNRLHEESPIPKATKPPNKKAKVDNSTITIKESPMKQKIKQNLETSLRRSPRKNILKIDGEDVIEPTPSPSKKTSKKQNLETSLRRSPRKNILKIDDKDVIEPTPSPSKKTSESKTSKLSSKLSARMKESTKKEKNTVVECSSNSSENKMRDGVEEYLSKAKKNNKNEVSIKEEKSPVTTPQRTSSKSPKSRKDSETPSSTKQRQPQPETPVAEKKKNFYQYKHREGPTNLGAKELPEGAENCLDGLTFVLTGVLDSFERETIEDHIKRYGGKVTKAVSGKTSYVIVGKDAGQSKLDKIAKHGTNQLDEDSFIDLVKSRPGKSNSGTPIRKESKTTTTTPSRKLSTPSPSSSTTPLQSKKLNMKMDIDKTPNTQSTSQSSSKTFTPKSLLSTPSSKESPCSQSPSISSQVSAADSGETLLWVDKYKPQRMKDIVGQHGNRSNANKLKSWLQNWKQNNEPNKSSKGFLAGKEDGSIFKAALLSGPPGVGKTTTATIVCKDIGFPFIEMNASDTRGKKALDTIIKESLSNVDVFAMMQGENNAGRNHVLIMDEVDGMAGNEDRGGMQELIQLIKKSKIPIICMCNDRNHQKIRSLANHCFDLRFYKPKVDQIKAFALKIAFRQGLNIPQQAMEQIVVGANQDIRQVVHNLQMWSSTKSTMTYDEAKDSAKNACKNIKMGPFDIVKTLFTHSESSKMDINKKIDLFFNDYSFVPLFMQENYLSANPKQGTNIHRTLDLISKTADAIADGNRVERLIRSEQRWSLLPLQGMYSTVLPSMLMSGYLGGRIDFPQWLGKNSSRNKHDRILQELKTHLALSANCMKTDINLNYIATLKRRLSEPLVQTGKEANMAAKEVIDLLESYDLTREDWDSIMEIGKWGNEPDITSKIPAKVKSAFTRQYNKESHKTPYAVHQSAKKAKGKATSSDDVLIKDGDDDNATAADDNDDDENDDDLSKDAMIKVKKEPVSGSSSGKGKSKTTFKKGAKEHTTKAKAAGKGKKK